MNKGWHFILMTIFLSVYTIAYSATVSTIDLINDNNGEEIEAQKSEAPEIEESSNTAEDFIHTDLTQIAAQSLEVPTDDIQGAVEDIFKNYGDPIGYISGTENGGAAFFGVRYGKGTLHGEDWRDQEIYWRSPSVGLDLGGNASKVFIFIYHLDNVKTLFQRIPNMGNSLDFPGNIKVTYMKKDDLVLAIMRSSSGWRAGVNMEYIRFAKEKSWVPF
ncbi:DUF1134 domain-containing protein [Candidatus Nitrosacidococcus sp. I8]|uniref:DUF1134 domain-containing protein n=1 Tax=Candidatus Nitrosacidococcus sp. I8 TaxID=2942908 RepID=UPI002225CBEA|nr:DUF1134 domain-containing protein [Candidatus Nitrosacidococcus sp. I8]CAH9018506.1 hypothetical protein NURINAE_00964 [Candidatus Nitrosacidococcus sp. I8]